VLRKYYSTFANLQLSLPSHLTQICTFRSIKTLATPYFLIKHRPKFVEISSDMIINRIASMVFDSFEGTDLIVAILGRSCSYVANKLDIFESVFSDQRILSELCRRIDDGQEPLIAHIDGYLIAASALTFGFDNIGYVVILLPDEAPEKSLECLDFVEIILNQCSLIAGLVNRNQQLKKFSKAESASLVSI
jgi:hypothetical protein